jgi:hypothetical protein
MMPLHNEPIVITPETLAGDSFRALHASYMDAKGKLEKVAALHRPFRIYGECDHGDDEDHGGNKVVSVEEIGETCEAGFMYEVCRECCCGCDSYQSEECASYHNHGKDKPICKTAALQ